MSAIRRSRLPMCCLVPLVAVGALSTGVELRAAQAAQMPPASEIDAIVAE